MRALRKQRSLNVPAAEERQAAKSAHLVYVTDRKPGFRRVKAGSGFAYRGPGGKPIRNSKILRRIRRLVIPPAWTDVWICPLENGHLQVTGRDDRGRKQYRYHTRWREVRDDAKYGRMAEFAAALPRMRRRISRDLRLPKLSQDKVLASVVRLLETTLIRVGNEEYARQNGSYGLTTMQNRHANVKGARIEFNFRGKSGKNHAIEITDKRIAKLVRRCQELPGGDLFQYIDEQGQVRDVNSSDVNDYLREISGQEFTAKDFRTWAGTLLAARLLREIGLVQKAPSKRAVAKMVQTVAEHLGNTPSVCRKCYVHPAVVDAYQNGHLTPLATLSQAYRGAGLRNEEAALIKLLKQHNRNGHSRAA